MTNYPNGQDNNITLPSVTGSTDEDIAINALRDATIAIEKELGISPSGIYSDVRARFDILEARINSPISPVILDDGYVNSPLYFVNTPAAVTLSISVGTGAPTESRVDGSLYLRSDGGVAQGLYSRRNGTWVQIITDPFVASGDLSGSYLNQTVVGLQGKPLRSTMTSVGAAQDGYHVTWNNTDGYWEAQTGFVAGGDLTAVGGSFGRRNQKVSGLQGRALAAAAPGGTTASNGDSLAWNSLLSQWEPQSRAIIFDGYAGRTNMRSNKILQSPIDNTKSGIVNFGSRSVGATTGTTDNYASILGGDRNTASGIFSLVVNGDSNVSSSLSSAVVSGLSNTASGQYSTVLNGTNNSATQSYAFTLDGYSNAATAFAGFVLGGNGHTNAGSYSGILNGIANSIVTGVFHSGIGFGASNQITNITANYSVILGGSGNQTSGQNSFIGTSTNAAVASAYSSVVNGLTNVVGATSPFSTILGGSTNTVAAASGYNLIGSGYGSTVTGQHATVLNSINGIANGLHSLVLNGNTNSVTGTFSSIVNGSNNTISGTPSYSTILDGYSNTITGSGSLIGDGYSNSISGLFSTILNGNGNSILGRNSTVLNGSSNAIDFTSAECTVTVGTSNSLTGTTTAMVSGNGNILNAASNSYVLGSFNSVLSPSSKVIGSSNIIGSAGFFNRVFGNSNTLGTASTHNTIFGSFNTAIGNSASNLVSGASNVLDTATGTTVLGSTNISNTSFASINGQYGKARLFGQQVHSNSRFTAGKVGEAQASRLVLTGNGGAGASFLLQLQDPAGATNITFVDGYSYELNVRVLVVNISPISPNPVVPARYVFDILAHAEGGVLVIDNVNLTLATPQASGNPWTVSVSGFGALAVPGDNQLVIQVDTEAGPPYVQPGNTPSSRRAIATIDMREISRI